MRDTVLKYSQLILILIVTISCKDKNDMINEKSKYDILISYNHYKIDSSIGRDYYNDKYLRDGKLYLILESQFDSDTIELQVNGRITNQDIITTDQSTGVARQYTFNNINEIKTIGLRINNGKQALIEIDTMNFFLVDFRDTILKVRVPKNAPYYD